VGDRTPGGREEFVVGPPDPVVEKAAAFLREFWSDGDSEDEVRADLRCCGAWSLGSIRDGLAALQRVLDEPSRGWCLTYLVEIDANCSLDECTEAAARTFLERCVALTEAVLRSPGL
jgi:hypothetical protein